MICMFFKFLEALAFYFQSTLLHIFCLLVVAQFFSKALPSSALDTLLVNDTLRIALALLIEIKNKYLQARPLLLRITCK